MLFLLYLLFFIQPTSQLCWDTGQCSDLRPIFLDLPHVGVEQRRVRACRKETPRATGRHDFSTLRRFRVYLNR